MLNKINNQPITHELSDAAQKAYAKIKALILRIFAIIKSHKKEKNIKEEFYDSYLDFAKILDEERFYEESNIYMSICEMYYHLIDRPDELIAHEGFFNDLFEAFDQLLHDKVFNPEDYDGRLDEFFKYYGNMRHYYYTNVAIPSSHFDEESLNEITGHLVSVL